MRLLLVEDQPELREAVARRLRVLGHAVDEAEDAASAQSFLLSYRYDLVVSDRLLPDGDALLYLPQWRKQGLLAPVLFLTACDSVQDRVDGLLSGADDYLGKPFSMDELVARVTAIARRGDHVRPSMLRIGDLEIDSARREVRRGGVLLPLRPKEFVLLQMLAERSGQVVPRAEIAACCWGEEQAPASNADEVTIASLRRKLGAPPLLRTVRGAGYLLEAADAQSAS